MRQQLGDLMLFAGPTRNGAGAHGERARILVERARGGGQHPAGADDGSAADVTALGCLNRGDVRELAGTGDAASDNARTRNDWKEIAVLFGCIDCGHSSGMVLQLAAATVRPMASTQRDRRDSIVVVVVVLNFVYPTLYG